MYASMLILLTLAPSYSTDLLYSNMVELEDIYKMLAYW